MSDTKVRAARQAFDDAHQTVRALIHDHVSPAARGTVEDAALELHRKGYEYGAAIVLAEGQARRELAASMTERPDPTPATREFIHEMATAHDDDRPVTCFDFDHSDKESA